MGILEQIWEFFVEIVTQIVIEGIFQLTGKVLILVTTLGSGEVDALTEKMIGAVFWVLVILAAAFRHSIASDISTYLSAVR